jgi:2-polyprenyl-6-methoxyphenol hydroxylase-like FAD-dependent oxidoreductase
MKKLKFIKILRNYSTNFYDIAIVGGGLIGGTLGKTLTTHPLSPNLTFTIIDPLQKTSPLRDLNSPPKDLRMVAISPSSKKLFEKIQIWDQVSQYAKKYNEMKVWDDFGSLIEFSEPELGYIVENSVITVRIYI